MSAHPAQVRDAVQNYIEQAYRPVTRFHVQKAVTDRLDTYFGAVASQMMYLEQDGKIAKYVSPEGTEFWYSPKSQSFCGTCGQLAFPGVHPDPACNRHQPAPGGTPTATITGMTEVKPRPGRHLHPLCRAGGRRRGPAQPPARRGDPRRLHPPPRHRRCPPPRRAGAAGHPRRPSAPNRRAHPC